MANPYDPLNSSDFKVMHAKLNEQNFESSAVDYMIKQIRLPKLRKLMRELPDFEYESFDMLAQVCDLPFKFTTSALTDEMPIYRDKKSVHPLWFKSFRTIPFVRKFEERLEEYLENSDKSKPFGMIFPRKGFANGMIIHTGDWNVYVGCSSGCHLYKGSDTFGSNYVVQPYRWFITTMLKEGLWSPEED